MNLKLLNYRNCNLQRDRFSDNLTTNPQLLMIADESLITELTATIYNAMNEQLTAMMAMNPEYYRKIRNCWIGGWLR
ncbi:MAG: hypothetical protein GPJ15_08300 [Microcystis aeruginosa G11-06]|nr:hypothetical protein [Microcystis aeruginosa G11-06]